MDNQPIGIFDSGSGGLTIWESIRKLLPYENMVYVGDHANIPYSTKRKEFIRMRGRKLISFLQEKKAKVIVVACNTATVTGVDFFRTKFPHIPIIGVVPVVKTAAETSKTGSFAVLSTINTKNSAYQKSLIRKFARNCSVLSLGNTELVTLIEEGNKNAKNIERIIKKLFPKHSMKNRDVIVLGCTHFPYIKDAVSRIVGPRVRILDSGDAVARHVQTILTHENALHKPMEKSQYSFYTTGDAKSVGKTIKLLLGRNVVVKRAEIA